MPALTMMIIGCGRKEQKEAVVVEEPGPPPVLTPAQLQSALMKANPEYLGEGRFEVQDEIMVGDLSETAITDLSPLTAQPFVMLDLHGLHISSLEPLRGMKLTKLFLENTEVEDLSPLEGMPIEDLYLSHTPVKDLSPLKGMPLKKLNLLGTPVTDLSPLKNSSVQFLWLNETPVSNISPLATCTNLFSLTLHKTKVSTLASLAGHPSLQRLHIGETPVTDLSPILDLKLLRLIFTPSNIRGGIDIDDRLMSISEIGTTFENRMPAMEFWSRYARGEFRPNN